MYSKVSQHPLANFGRFINAKEGGGDSNRTFPASDADDIHRGARFIPGQVTEARRQGKQVRFNQACGSCCWYWQMPDGSRIYHWDRPSYEQIAQANGYTVEGYYRGSAGPCPHCGNPHTKGGVVTAAEIALTSTSK